MVLEAVILRNLFLAVLFLLSSSCACSFCFPPLVFTAAARFNQIHVNQRICPAIFKTLSNSLFRFTERPHKWLLCHN